MAGIITGVWIRIDHENHSPRTSSSQINCKMKSLQTKVDLQYRASVSDIHVTVPVYDLGTLSEPRIPFAGSLAVLPEFW